MFFEGDLQSGIARAVQESKAVLCFIHDDSTTSAHWEDALQNSKIIARLTADVVALRLKASSQEAGFLTPFCPIQSTPAVLIIRDGKLQDNWQAGQLSQEEFENELSRCFGASESASENATDASRPEEAPTVTYIDLPPSTGRMRLPENAYDALRVETEKFVDQGISPRNILTLQIRMLENIPSIQRPLQELRLTDGSVNSQLPDAIQDQLLNTPAGALKSTPSSSQGNATTSPNPPRSADVATQPATRSVHARQTLSPVSRTSPEISSAASTEDGNANAQKARAQRNEYISMQKERERKQREERERIKAQIKADREERRHREEIRKQGESSTTTDNITGLASASIPTRTDLRIQVRTFDGSTLRTTLPASASISTDVRPWIDRSSNLNVPYNLKLILTPLPNRNIEASEEEQDLSDLGIRGSCTMVMVPVKGFVESYTGSTPGGMVGSAVSTGFGIAGSLFGGVKSILGYGAAPVQQQEQHSASTDTETAGSESGPGSQGPRARVRTLADQRAESAKKDQQFYNGNQLNFQPRKEDENKSD